MLKKISQTLLLLQFLLITNSALAQHPEAPKSLNVGVLLYPGFEIIDVFGPTQMWGYIPDFKLIMVAEKEGPVRSAQGTLAYAEYAFDNAPKLDILLVPGGTGTQAQLNNEKLLNFVKTTHENTQYTTSVCTGSAILAKVGALDGERATTNKRFFFLSEKQSDKVNWVEQARWVESGKVFTSSGVTAGTDMALGLIQKMYGERWATGIASSLEYTWNPDSSNDPFHGYTNRLLDDNNGLISAMPSVNASVDTPPQWVWLFYEDTPLVSESDIQLVNTENPDKPLELYGLHTMGSDDLMIGVSSALPKGQYEIKWKTQLEGENEKREGKYQFSVTE